MKIFVSGGAGFIGRHLVRSLSKSNHEISIFENFTNSNINEIQDIVNDGAKIIKGDLNNFKLLKKSLRNIDVVIHLAAKIDILESIKQLGHKDVTYLKNHKDVINLLNQKKDSFDVLVTQGAGSVSKVCASIKDKWKA